MVIHAQDWSYPEVQGAGSVSREFRMPNAFYLLVTLNDQYPVP